MKNITFFFHYYNTLVWYLLRSMNHPSSFVMRKYWQKQNSNPKTSSIMELSSELNTYRPIIDCLFSVYKLPITRPIFFLLSISLWLWLFLLSTDQIWQTRSKFNVCDVQCHASKCDESFYMRSLHCPECFFVSVILSLSHYCSFVHCHFRAFPFIGLRYIVFATFEIKMYHFHWSSGLVCYIQNQSTCIWMALVE